MVIRNRDHAAMPLTSIIGPGSVHCQRLHPALGRSERPQLRSPRSRQHLEQVHLKEPNVRVPRPRFWVPDQEPFQTISFAPCNETNMYC